MTKVIKPVSREVEIDNRTALMVTIHPNGLLEMREKRGRKAYFLAIKTAYYMAVKNNKE